MELGWMVFGNSVTSRSCPPVKMDEEALLWSSGVVITGHLHGELIAPKIGCPRSRPTDSGSGEDPLFPRWLLATVSSQQVGLMPCLSERCSRIVKTWCRQKPTSSV